MLEYMVPKELSVPKGYLIRSFCGKLYDLIKMTKESERQKSTYLLPVDTRLGLMSALLKAAKKSSQGAAS